jgi:hypothetical protein
LAEVRVSATAIFCPLAVRHVTISRLVALLSSATGDLILPI